MGKAGQTFEICCLCLVDMYHKLSFQDTLCLDETAGTAHHLFGNHVRMSRSKTEQHSTILNAVRHHVSSFQNVLHLCLFNTVDHGSHCLNIGCCCHVVPPESDVVRRLKLQTRLRRSSPAPSPRPLHYSTVPRTSPGIVSVRLHLRPQLIRQPLRTYFGLPRNHPRPSRGNSRAQDSRSTSEVRHPC